MGANDRIFGRHIPKEHVGQAAAWEFAPLAGAASSTSARLSEREQRAYNRGREIGYAEATVAAQRVRASHVEQVERALDALRARFAELEDAGAERVLDLAVALAGAVLRRAVSIEHDALLPALREAIAQLVDTAAQPRIALHPADFARLRADLDADAALRGCRFTPDPTIEPGGCRVVTPAAEVDATLPTRWARALATLGIPAAVAAAHRVPVDPRELAGITTPVKAPRHPSVAALDDPIGAAARLSPTPCPPHRFPTI